MVRKRTSSKTRLHTTPCADHLPKRVVLSFRNDSEILSPVVAELCTADVPKMCECFLHNACTSNQNDKSKGKQSGYKNCAIKRVTTVGIQTGETTPAAKPVPLGDVESEIGRVGHGIGILSMCRSASCFDGSQFFICTTKDEDELEYLNKRHVAFAKIIEGLNVVISLKEQVLPFVKNDGVVDDSCPFFLSSVTPCEM